MVKKNNLLQLVILLLVLVSVILFIRRFQILIGKAEKIPVEVNIDGATAQQFPRIWQNFAQGGEEKEKMIEPVKNEVTDLGADYIRIDHIYDFYDVVDLSSGSIKYNWSELDERIQEILDTGALPFLSLSYLPPSFSSDSVVGKPKSYEDWQNLVQATIEHFSGRNGKNLSGVYYEVWNEPDLFGKMSPSEYFLLYSSAAKGAARCQNVNPFKFGGPATIGANRTWLNNFLGAISRSGARLDFISWHSYGTNPQKIKLESEAIDNLANYSLFKGEVEKLVTEWGPDSEISPVYDSSFAASHAIAVVSQSLGKADRLFAFELKDGLDPAGKKFWGRWGLLTHQKFGVTKKPRYFSFTALNQLEKFFLPNSANYPYVYTISSTDGLGNYFIITTFLPFQGKAENKQTLIKINNFLPGEFRKSLNGSLEVSYILPGTTFEETLNLEPFSVKTISLKRISSATTKTNGAARIISPLPALVYPLFSPLLGDALSGEISFEIKPSWDGSDPKEKFFLETRLSPTVSLYAKTRKSSELVSFLDFNFDQNGLISSVSLDISAWQKDQWHRIIFSWDNTKMELKIKADTEEKTETLGVINNVKLGKFLYLGSDFLLKNQAEADIDNVEVKINNRTIYQENFD